MFSYLQPMGGFTPATYRKLNRTSVPVTKKATNAAYQTRSQTRIKVVAQTRETHSKQPG